MIAICILVLTLYLMLRKKYLNYGAIVLSLTVFFCFLLLDAMVFIRYNGNIPYSSGYSFSAEYNRIVQGGEGRWVEMLCNTTVFVPLGFFLSEFLYVSKRFCIRRRLAFVVLSAFVLSLIIECLQLLLRLGLFEFTDMVMNSVGAFIGACFASLIRAKLRKTTMSINPS